MCYDGESQLNALLNGLFHTHTRQNKHTRVVVRVNIPPIPLVQTVIEI